MAARRQVRRGVTVAAAPEVVWRALVEGDLVARWLGTGAGSQAPGSAAERLHADDGTVWARHVVSADHARRLVYWWWRETGATPAAGDVSVVEIELGPAGAGTRVTVTETALPDHHERPPGPDGEAVLVALRAGSQG